MHELQDPVEDQKGYVYDKKAIYAYIDASRGGQVQCPVMGCTHMVSRATLKPCTHVLKRRERQQRQQRWAGTQAQTQPAGAADGGEEVLEA